MMTAYNRLQIARVSGSVACGTEYDGSDIGSQIRREPWPSRTHIT